MNSTFIVARSYCTRVFEVDSIGPFTVQRIVVFPWEMREDPEEEGWIDVWYEW